MRLVRGLHFPETLEHELQIGRLYAIGAVRPPDGAAAGATEVDAAGCDLPKDFGDKPRFDLEALRGWNEAVVGVHRPYDRRLSGPAIQPIEPERVREQPRNRRL